MPSTPPIGGRGSIPAIGERATHPATTSTAPGRPSFPAGPPLSGRGGKTPSEPIEPVAEARTTATTIEPAATDARPTVPVETDVPEAARRSSGPTRSDPVVEATELDADDLEAISADERASAAKADRVEALEDAATEKPPAAEPDETETPAIAAAREADSDAATAADAAPDADKDLDRDRPRVPKLKRPASADLEIPDPPSSVPISVQVPSSRGVPSWRDADLPPEFDATARRKRGIRIAIATSLLGALALIVVVVRPYVRDAMNPPAPPPPPLPSATAEPPKPPPVAEQPTAAPPAVDPPKAPIADTKKTAKPATGKPGGKPYKKPLKDDEIEIPLPDPE
jgi:hypothetical protein